MNLLVDTHVLLWWLDDPTLLSTAAQKELDDLQNRVYVSAAVGREIAIKRSLGKLTAPADLLPAVVSAGFEPLPVTLEDALAVEQLPMHPRDPFDRLLIAQANLHSCSLVTRDSQMTLYNVATIPA